MPIPKEASAQDKPFTNTDAIEAAISIIPILEVFHAFMLFIFIDLGLCYLHTTKYASDPCILGTPDTDHHLGLHT